MVLILIHLGHGNLSTEETKVCSSLAAGRSCEHVLMWGKRVSLGEAHGTFYLCCPLFPKRILSVHMSATYLLATLDTSCISGIANNPIKVSD